MIATKALWRLAADERGAAYTLSVMLTIPFLMLLVITAMETTFLLSAKLGVAYAGYAARTSASVWWPAEPRELGERRVLLSAIQAMIPYSSGNPKRVLGTNPGFPEAALAFAAAYRRYAPDGPVGEGHFLTTHRYASAATSVTIEPRAIVGSPWDIDLLVTVRFEHPTFTPLFGRLIGHPAPWGGSGLYTYTIVSQGFVRAERPRNDDGTLGIAYQSH